LVAAALMPDYTGKDITAEYDEDWTHFRRIKCEGSGSVELFSGRSPRRH